METSVTKVLDDQGIEYKAIKHKTPVFTCEEAARERNVRISQILKCMVVKDSASGIYVMLIPGDKKLKTGKLPQITGGNKVALVSPEELSSRYGLTVGAISPIHFLGSAKFYLDKTALSEAVTTISSGSPEAGVELKMKDLVDLIKPLICDIV